MKLLPPLLGGALAIGTLTLARASAASHDADAERQTAVAQINAVPGVKWRAAVETRFQGQPLGAIKPLLGVKEGNQEMMAARVKAGTMKLIPKISAQEAQALPVSFDSATNPKWAACRPTITDIRDQSNCGCCWAFAAAEAASDRMCIATNGTVVLPLSANDICFCANNNGCGGGFLPQAWDYIASYGAVTGGGQGGGAFDTDGLCSAFTLPHCHHHGPVGNDPYPAEGAPGCPTQNSPACPTSCDPSAHAPHANFTGDKFKFSGDTVTYAQDADTIAQAIMGFGPVEAAFTVYADFENYAGGIYHHVTGDQMGGHAIRIVGWGVDNTTKYWKVANSWNPYWGEQGYFRIMRGTNECGIEAQVTSSSSDSVWSGGILPPPPPPNDDCKVAMQKYCGDAKSGGPDICMGCCQSYAAQLSAAGCHFADENTWCNST